MKNISDIFGGRKMRGKVEESLIATFNEPYPIVQCETATHWRVSKFKTRHGLIESTYSGEK